MEKFEKMIQDTQKSLDGLKSAIEAKAATKDFEDLKTSLNDIKVKVEGVSMVGDKAIQDYVKTQQEQIDSLETKILKEIKSGDSKPMTLKERIGKMTAEEDFAKKIKEGHELTIKASDMTTSSFTGDSGTIGLDQLFLPGIAKAPWRDNPLFAATPKQVVGEKIHEIAWYEETSKTNSAAGVAEQSGSFAQSDAAWTRYKEDFYKLGHHAEFTEEMLEDSLYAQGEINDLLQNGLLRKIEADMFNGVGSGSNTILGMLDSTSGWAKDFAKPTGTDTITSPNNFDVLSVAKDQVGLGDTGKTFNKGFIATVAFVNPAELGNLRRLRDDNGQYYIPMITSQGVGIVVDGLLLVPSFDVAVNKFVVCNPERAKAYIKRNITLKRSENVASNFLTDVITIKASIRLAYVHKNVDEFAFVYGDFDTAKTAITTT